MLTNLLNYNFANVQPWWPGLSTDLARHKWDKLNIIGVDRNNYSTASFIESGGFTSEGKAAIHDFAKMPLQIEIEFLCKSTQSILSKNGLAFYSYQEYCDGSFSHTLRGAFAQINAAPTLFRSLLPLIRYIVLLKPADNTSDTSFSSPRIPFTIFISVPQAGSNVAMRVAESIIHECMHLQLTLTEEIAPLIASDSSSYFSPWKNEVRKLSGILHGLYVFTVIHQWLKSFHGIESDSYVQNRIKQIEAEMVVIREVSTSPELTQFGKMITTSLLSHLPTDGAI